MSRMRAMAVIGLLIGLLAPSSLQAAGGVEVGVVNGPLDHTAVAFLRELIGRAEREGSMAVVLQLDAPAVLVPIDELLEEIRTSPVPVITWIGPTPAVARGGLGRLMAASHLSMAAPGARIGYLSPEVLGRDADPPSEVPPSLLGTEVEVEGPIPGLVEETAPTIGQVVVGLDGEMLTTAAGQITLKTAEPDAEAGGMTPSVPVRFHEPALGPRLLRLGVRPEGAFFFAVVGLSLIVFEFFALGPGLAAAAGALFVVPGLYGLAALPVRPAGLALTLGGMLAMSTALQRGRSLPLAILGVGALAVGGFTLVEGGSQLAASWWGISLTTALAALFLLVATPSVLRARFSTPTIGRDDLVGRRGVALTDLTPEGVVEIDGARWGARAHREAGISKGDQVVVSSVRGSQLRVDPADSLE